MPILDVSEQNASLDNDYGATHGPNAPDSHDLILLNGDPLVDGVEISATTEIDDGAGGTTTVSNGYAAVSIANDATWAAADSGAKSTVDPVQFPDATQDWEPVWGWALRNPDTSGIADYHPLSEIANVDGGSTGIEVVPTITYDNQVVAS